MDPLQRVGAPAPVGTPVPTEVDTRTRLREIQYYYMKSIGQETGPPPEGYIPPGPVLGGGLNGYTGQTSTPGIGSPAATRSMIAQADPVPVFTPTAPIPAQAPASPSPGGFVGPDMRSLNSPPPPQIVQTPPPEIIQTPPPDISNNPQTMSDTRSFRLNEETRPEPAPEKKEDPEDNPAAGDIPEFDYSGRLLGDASFLDDKPQDTWAPNARRSKEHLALDNMKMTPPEVALAKWREEKARLAKETPPAAPVATTTTEPAAPPLAEIPPQPPVTAPNGPVNLDTGYFNPNLSTVSSNAQPRPPAQPSPAPYTPAWPPGVMPPLVTPPGLQGRVENYRTQWQANATFPDMLSSMPTVSPVALGLQPGVTAGPIPQTPPPGLTALAPVSPNVNSGLLSVAWSMMPGAAQRVENSAYATPSTLGWAGRVTPVRRSNGDLLSSAFGG